MKKMCLFINCSNLTYCRLHYNIGILEGSMIHLDDAQDYLNSTTIYDTGTATTSNNSHNDNSNNDNTINPIIEQKIKKSSFYIQICQAIHTSIQTTLSTIQSVHKSKLQTWHKRVQQHQQYNKFIDSSILNQPNDSNNAFVKCILNYESGKVLYMLGVTLAKKFTNGSSSNSGSGNIFVSRICTNEKIQFLEYSLEKFRSSLQYLSTVSSSSNNNNNNATISHILQSKQQLPTVEREINLSIADTLSCVAYIFDVEQNDYTKSSEYYNQSLTLYADIYGTYHMTCSQTLHNLGTLHVFMKKYDDALKYYTECLNIRKHIQKEQEDEENENDDNEQTQQRRRNRKNIMNEEEVGHTYRCMAETCRNIGNLSLAKQYNQMALKIFVQVCGKDQLIVALILSSIASLYLDDTTTTTTTTDNGNSNKYKEQKKNFIFSENYQQVLECLNESIRIRKLHYNHNNNIVSYSSNNDGNNNHQTTTTWKNVGYDLAHNMHSKGKLLLWNSEYKESLHVFQEEMKLREELLDRFITIHQKRIKDVGDVAADEKGNNNDSNGIDFADDELQRKEEDHYDHIIRILLCTAQIYAQNNEYDNILSSCVDLLKPIDVMIHNNNVKQLQKGKKWNEKKILLDRNHADVLFLMGRALLKKNKYMEAYTKFESALNIYESQLQQPKESSPDYDINTTILLQSKIASTLYFIGTIYHDVDVDWIQSNLSDNNDDVNAPKDMNNNNDDGSGNDEAINYFKKSIELRMSVLHSNQQNNNTLLSKSAITLAQLQMSDMLYRSVQLSNEKKDDNKLTSTFLSYIIKSIQMKEQILLPFLSEIALSPSSSENDYVSSWWYDNGIGEQTICNGIKEYPIMIEELDYFHLYFESDDKQELDALFGCYRLYIDMSSTSNNKLQELSDSAYTDDVNTSTLSSSWVNFTKEITNEVAQYFTNPTITVIPTDNETDDTNSKPVASSSTTFPSILQVSSVTVNSKDIVTSVFTKEKILWKMATIYIYKHLHDKIPINDCNNDSTDSHLEKASQLLRNVSDLLSTQQKQRLQGKNDDEIQKNELNSFLGHYVYPSLGFIYSLNRKYDKAKKRFMNALQLLRKNDTPEDEEEDDDDEESPSITEMNTIPAVHAKVLISLGKVEIELGEYKNAVMYLEEGLTAQQRIFFREENQQGQQTMSSSLDDLSSTRLEIGTTLYYLGVAYEYYSITDHRRTSLSLFFKALKIKTYKLGKRHVHISDILLHIGHLQRKAVLCSKNEKQIDRESQEEHLKEAKKFYDEALKLKKEAYDYQTGKSEQLIASYRNKAVHLDEIASLTCNIGEVYGLQKKYEDAVNNYRQSLTMYQSQQQEDKSNISCDPSTKSIADIYDALGEMYYGMNSNEESLKCFQESLNLRNEFISSNESPDERTSAYLKIASTYYKIGFVHESMMLLDDALESFTESLKLHRQFLTSKQLLDLSTANLLDSMSEIYFTHKQDYNLALKACRQALKIYRGQCGDNSIEVSAVEVVLICGLIAY